MAWAGGRYARHGRRWWIEPDGRLPVRPRIAPAVRGFSRTGGPGGASTNPRAFLSCGSLISEGVCECGPGAVLRFGARPGGARAQASGWDAMGRFLCQSVTGRAIRPLASTPEMAWTGFHKELLSGAETALPVFHAIPTTRIDFRGG